MILWEISFSNSWIKKNVFFINDPNKENGEF